MSQDRPPEDQPGWGAQPPGWQGQPPPPQGFDGGQQGGWNQPPQGWEQGGVSGYQQPPKTETTAIVALVLSIVGIFICGIILGVAGFIVGTNALKKIEASGGTLTGEGMAKAARIIGVIAAVLGAIFAYLIATSG